jgi:cytochrome P450
MTALNGEAHDHARASAMKALHKKILERQCEQVGAVVDAVLSSWPLARPLDLWRALTAVPVITSARLLFGIRDAGEACRVGEDVDRWLGANFTLGSRLLRYDWPGFSYRAVLRAADVVESAMKAHIGAYKETADSEVLCHFLDAYGDPGDAAALNEIVRQSVTLFAASYETLVSGLAWTVFLLAQHPPIACDLYDEVDGRLGEGYPTVAQIEHLPLLDAVIKEALRILPPVPYTIRVPAEAVEVGGLALQRGDRIVLSHYVTHHSADLYAEPERFDPRRWERCQPSPYEFLPFSAGPRFCVGYHFAMMVMKVTLAMMLQRYRFRVVPGSRIDRIVRVTLRPKYGMPVVLHPPDRRFERVPVRGAIHEMVSIP